jgi:RNA recognition motif-containing protein
MMMMAIYFILQTGYSYGFGFVNFLRDEDGISAQSKMNGFELQSKRIKVSFARPPSDDNKHTNLYVTNLPRDGTEDDLLKLFKPYGTIVQSKLLTDKYTKLPRGVAFVRYETREQASNAILAMHEFMPEGQIEPIRVRLAEDHGKRRASYLAGFQAGMGILAKHHNHHYRQQTSSYRGSSKGPSAEVDNFRTRRSHCNENGGGGGGKWISSSKHHHRRNSYDRGNSRSRSER